MAKQWTEVLGGGLTGGSSDVLKYSLIVQASGARGWMSRPRRQQYPPSKASQRSAPRTKKIVVDRMWADDTSRVSKEKRIVRPNAINNKRSFPSSCEFRSELGTWRPFQLDLVPDLIIDGLSSMSLFMNQGHLAGLVLQSEKGSSSILS